MSQEYVGMKCTINGAKYEIPFKKITDLFSFNNSIPIVGIATSGKGKTTFALDVMRQFAPKARYVYYVTQTSGNLIGRDELQTIPSYFKRDPLEIGCYECLSGIWHDIVARAEGVNASKHLKPVLSTLFPGFNVFDEVSRYTSSLNMGDVERGMVQMEIISRLIIDKVNTKPELLDCIQTDEERNVINGMISGSVNSLLILDDVSSILKSVRTDKQKVAAPNGTIKTKKEAMNELLKDIFTRARHYSCLIIMFVHDLSVFEDDTISNFQRYLFFDKAGVQTIIGKRRFNQQARDFLETIIQPGYTDIFNEQKYSYYCLYYDMFALSNVAVTKAELHDDSEIPKHPDVAKFHALLDRIQNNTLIPKIDAFAIDSGQQAKENWADGKFSMEENDLDLDFSD